MLARWWLVEQQIFTKVSYLLTYQGTLRNSFGVNKVSRQSECSSWRFVDNIWSDQPTLFSSFFSVDAATIEWLDLLTPVKVCKEFLQLTWNVNFCVFLKVCVCFVTKTMGARLSTHMELCSGLWNIAASPKFCWRLKEVMTILTRAYLLGAGDKWKSVSLGVKTAHDKILQFSIYSPVTTPIYTNILSN